MRISILQQREPFGEIFSQTIAGYWRSRYGWDIKVEWGGGKGQQWWGNSYLNFFADSAVSSSAFDVLRREYSHSRVIWRRPLQRAYVRLATTPVLLRFFSDVRFSVSPALEGSHDLLVLGGNHRLRLLQPVGGRSTVILKERFSREHITRELELRTDRKLGCAPALLAANSEQGWFDEEYFPGTPINRIPAEGERAHKKAAVQSIWQEVVEPTLEWTPVRDWADDLALKFAELVKRSGGAGGERLLRISEELRGQLVAGGGGRKIPVSWTHGDLQEANIVINGSRRCVIDWESADRRFAAYDFYQLATGGRWSDNKWPSRVARAVSGEDGVLGEWLRKMPELLAGEAIPHWWGFAYVLEELLFRARDNAEPAFYRPGAGWESIAHQAECAFEALKAGGRQ